MKPCFSSFIYWKGNEIQLSSAFIWGGHTFSLVHMEKSVLSNSVDLPLVRSHTVICWWGCGLTLISPALSCVVHEKDLLTMSFKLPYHEQAALYVTSNRPLPYFRISEQIFIFFYQPLGKWLDRGKFKERI